MQNFAIDSPGAEIATLVEDIEASSQGLYALDYLARKPYKQEVVQLKNRMPTAMELRMLK